MADSQKGSNNNNDKVEIDNDMSNVNIKGNNNIPDHFWDITDTDTLHRFILDYQNPIDQGLALTTAMLNTWTLEELQCACNILSGPAYFYGKKIPSTLGAVSKPDADTITQEKANWMKEQRQRFLKQRQNCNKSNQNKQRSPTPGNDRFFF